MISSDSIEIIEENLFTDRADSLCQVIISQCDTLWCFSLRNCNIKNLEFEKLVRILKKCKMLRYLNFNLNLINTFHRVTYLATLLPGLNYLDTLCLHSSNLKDEGLRVLYYSLINNEHFRSLDIGDCRLTDDSVEIIREFIHRKEQKNGLYELTISSNQKITPIGWSQILIAVAAAADLKNFHMDYNNLDESCGYLIAAILTSNRSLKVLDLEHTGLTNKTGSLLLYLVKHYNVTVKNLNLLHNQIDEALLNQIRHYIEKDNDFDSVVTQSAYRNNEIKTLPVLTSDHKSYDIKILDQHKLDNYASRGRTFNEREKDQGLTHQYEKTLERDYIEIKEKYVELYRPIKIDTEDTLEPIEDLRFKRHNVLPFNILQ